MPVRLPLILMMAYPICSGFTVTANKDAKDRLGVWFPNRINAGKATVTIGGTATPIEKAGLLTNDFLLLRELELKKGEKAVVEME